MSDAARTKLVGPFFDDDRQDTIQTYTGGRFSVVEPRADEVRVADVAHALSMVCRFNGHTSRFYSVCAHAMHVAEIVRVLGGTATEQFAALHHEDSEAYLCDLPRPIKQLTALGEHYREVEARVMDAVADALSLPRGFHKWPIVKRADEIALVMEARELMGDPEWARAYAATLDLLRVPAGQV